jgi:hypothetical protein
MYDASGFADHWIDLLVATLVSGLGYFVDSRLRAFDARHKRAEDEFQKINDKFEKLCERTARLEVEVEKSSADGR